MPGTHGSINRAGKVRKQTPKIEQKEVYSKKKVGRAAKRNLYNKRINQPMKYSPNSQK